MSKIKLENFVQYGRLFEIYGTLLSEEKQRICEEYFSFNMTLAEIAESRQISRQAAFDAIQKSCQKFDKFETSLQILEKKQALIVWLNALQKDCPKIKEKVEKIIEEL